MTSGPRFAVHTALWQERWGEDIAPHLQLAAELGFDGAEVTLLGLDRAAAGRLRQTALDCGLTILCTTGLSPATDITNSDPSVRRAGITYLDRTAELVATLGASLLTGVIHAPWGTFGPGPRHERLARAVEALAEVAPVFARLGITLGIEALNRFECDLANTAEEAVELAEQVGAPNLGVLLDTFHMNIEEPSLSRAIAVAAPRLVHLQVAENHRGVPGTGHLDWQQFGLGVKAINYTGWISLEMFVRPDVSVSHDLRVWRPVVSDPSEAARQGLAFLKNLLHREPPGSEDRARSAPRADSGQQHRRHP